MNFQSSRSSPYWSGTGPVFFLVFVVIFLTDEGKNGNVEYPPGIKNNRSGVILKRLRMSVVFFKIIFHLVCADHTISTAEQKRSIIRRGTSPRSGFFVLCFVFFFLQTFKDAIRTVYVFC